MTSNPASRKALAITLAPRSWPSRPGLATRTRILRSSFMKCPAGVESGWEVVSSHDTVPTREPGASLESYSVACDASRRARQIDDVRRRTTPSPVVTRSPFAARSRPREEPPHDALQVGDEEG